MAKMPDGHRYMKNCLECNAQFRTFPSEERKGGGKFCSKDCGRAYNSVQAIIRNTRCCKVCKSDFIIKPAIERRGYAKYCSKECGNKGQSALKKNKPKSWTKEWKDKLLAANNARKGKPSSKRGKAYPHLRGENNPLWKGGCGERRDAMGRIEYKTWRTAVFTRDNYTCQICDQYGGTLHADHIERWADNEELRYNVDNGRTLCVPCHYYITFKTKMKPGTKWCNFTAGKRG